MTRYPRQGRGRRWTIKELEAVRPEWKGDMLSDGDGLVGEVRLTAEGIVFLPFRYGFKWEGKKAWHYCGAWPSVSMEAIRAERDRGRALIKTGVNPTDARRAARIDAQAEVQAKIAEAARIESENLPIRAMYEAWIRDGVSRADGNAVLRRYFEKDVLPSIGEKAVRLTTEGDLRVLLRAIIKRGACRMASIVHSSLIQMFKWAEKRKPWRALMADGNPADLVEFKKLLPPGVEPDAERERVLSGEELRELRLKLDDMENVYAAASSGTKYRVDRPLKKETQLALWICLGTMCRIGELLKARWEHVDLATGEWFVPREDTKTKVAWKVYLSPFALRQFKALYTLTGETQFCFPSNAMTGEEPARHVCVKSVSKQVGDRQVRFKKRKPLKNRRHDDSLVLEDGKNGEWTPHDLRRTGATMMQQLGVLPDVIDRCQNHVLAGSRIRRAYLHYDYAKEKREAWERLGQRIDALLDNANVVTLNRFTTPSAGQH